EAAIINEKGVDPELAMDALRLGIALYEEHAQGKIVSELIDIYPNKKIPQEIRVSKQKIEEVIGIPVSIEKSAEILRSLDFKVKTDEDVLDATPPSFRVNDIQIPEDVIEE